MDHSKIAFTVQEACDLLSISRAQLYRLIDTKELGSITIGRCRRITSTQLERFIRTKEESSSNRGWRPLLDHHNLKSRL